MPISSAATTSSPAAIAAMEPGSARPRSTRRSSGPSSPASRKARASPLFGGSGRFSASLNLLTWPGARPRDLPLGTGVRVLPGHTPVLLAEQAAPLDLLSGGRLDFGIGKGYRHNEFAGFCIPLDEADARFEESLEVITKAFTSETPFSHSGRYGQFRNNVVGPPTPQKPLPPCWLWAG